MCNLTININIDQKNGRFSVQTVFQHPFLWKYKYSFPDLYPVITEATVSSKLKFAVLHYWV